MLSVRAYAKAVYLTTLRILRRDDALLARIREDALVVALNFHRVSPYPNPYYQPVDPRHFDELIGWLKRKFVVTTFGGIATAERRRPIAVLSFDDGYRDFVEYAMPILHKHRVPANMNVIPACVESGKPIWNARLYDLLNASPPSLLRRIRLPGFERSPEGTDAHSRGRFAAALSHFLKTRPRTERDALWPQIERLFADVDAKDATPMMREADVLEAAKEHEIGAHSYSHESMAFESDAFFEQDFAACQTFFEKLQLSLRVYAFPNGSYRFCQIDRLLSEGIEHVLLVEEKLGRRGARVHPRITMGGESRWELQLRALGHQARGVA